MNNTEMLILFLVTLLGTIFFTWYVKRILIKAKIADSPIVSEHRHKSGTPTMGGIAFLFTISLIISLYYQNTPILIVSFIMLAGGIIGLVDDLIGLKIKEIQKIVVNISDEVITLGRLDVEPGEEVRVATPKAKAEVDDLLRREAEFLKHRGRGHHLEVAHAGFDEVDRDVLIDQLQIVLVGSVDGDFISQLRAKLSDRAADIVGLDPVLLIMLDAHRVQESPGDR